MALTGVCLRPQHSTEREWLFGLLRQGMRDKHCYELYARRGVFHVVLSFFSSPLCDPAAQVGAPKSLRPPPVHVPWKAEALSLVLPGRKPCNSSPRWAWPLPDSQEGRSGCGCVVGGGGQVDTQAHQ